MNKLNQYTVKIQKKKLKGSIRFRFLDFKRIYFKVKIDFTLKKYHIAMG